LETRAHFYTWSGDLHRASCGAKTVLRRFAPYKGLRPLRCFAAIPIPQMRRSLFISKIKNEEVITMKTREQLLIEQAKIQDQLKQEQHKNQRTENRINYLESGDRRKRNHRLITRGAAVESITPEVKPLTEVEFYSMMEHILSLPESKTAVVFAVTNHEKAIPLEVE